MLVRTEPSLEHRRLAAKVRLAAATYRALRQFAPSSSQLAALRQTVVNGLGTLIRELWAADGDLLLTDLLIHVAVEGRAAQRGSLTGGTPA
jgi:hypothetical protein